MMLFKKKTFSDEFQALCKKHNVTASAVLFDLKNNVLTHKGFVGPKALNDLLMKHLSYPAPNRAGVRAMARNKNKIIQIH